MQIERACTYYESFLPTPRHRKLRYREVHGKVTADIREVTSAEAPVAIVHYEPRSLSRIPVCRDRGKPNRIEYHWYEGKFYTTIRRSRYCCYYGDDVKNKGMKLARLSDISWHYNGVIVDELESRQSRFTESMSRYLLIDGKLCEEIGEPRYVVMTFGLGNNHGGTALMTSNYFNSNIVTESYFRADEEAEAREAAMVVAAGRGDTKDLPGLKRRHYHRFDILIPEAITMEREERPDTVDSFSARATAITNSGLPPVMAGFSLLAAVFR